MSIDSLAASRCRSPILRRMYPSANPIAEHHTETMNRTTNNESSFATNVRIWKAGYVMRHRAVKMAMRERLGLSKPRKRSFCRRCFNLEAQVLSACCGFVVDGGGEGEAGYSEELLSPMRTCCMLGYVTLGFKRGRSHPMYVQYPDIRNRNELYLIRSTGLDWSKSHCLQACRQATVF